MFSFLSDVPSKIRTKIRAREYEDAYLLAKRALAKHANDQAVQSALLELADQLRSECMDLAYSKRDIGTTYESKESLLREVNALIGLDMYGRPSA